MTKEQEKEEIKKRFDHYYYNCDDWSLGDIDFQLRLDFWEPVALTHDEACEYINQLVG